jgi:predicted nucleic acid-binding protein
MPYLIDSNWVIQHLLDVSEAVVLLRRLAPAGIAVSIITYMESFQGTLRAPPTYTPERFQAFFSTVPVLPLSVDVAERCARIRESLGQQGRSVRPRALDLIIAATALEHDLILVTRNEDDYRDIPDLRLYEPSESEEAES